jgi:cell division septum initiation protein DivIVA
MKSKKGRCTIAILQLIDQLVDLLNRGTRIPLSAYTVIDANEFYHLLERMRINVPSSIMEGERTLAERDRILAEARAEAERVVHQARQRAAELLTDQALVAAARQEADRMVEEGRTIAHRRAEEADQYAVKVLEELAQKLQMISKQVDNGVQVMRQNRLAAEPPDREDGFETATR